ncbi:Enolase 4 [Schistosoma japonicum]|nr:Enolase 4 [Schistosoma japonicum]
MLEVDKYIRNYYDEYKRRLHETQINEVEKDEVNTDTKEVGLKSTSPNNANCTKQVIEYDDAEFYPLSVELIIFLMKSNVIKTITNDKQSNSSISTGINEHKKVTCPIITIFNCPGRTGALQSGKCRFLQEVLLIPKPYLKPKELLNNLLLIRTNLSQYLLNKTNVKERYEIITGSLKTPEELVNYYVDLITRYPQIRLLIDPFRAEDKECWELLRTRITFPILITTSTTIQPSMKLMIPNRSNSIATKNSTIIQTTNLCNELIQFSTSTGLSIYELINCQDDNEHVNDQQINDTSLQTMPIINSTDKHSLYYSTWLFTLDTCLDCVLVTEVIQAVYKMHKENRQVIFSLDNLNAIGLGIDFIKITGLNRIDQMNKLLAWYNYYEEEDIMNEWKLYDSSLLEESI